MYRKNLERTFSRGDTKNCNAISNAMTIARLGHVEQMNGEISMKKENI